jgi:CDP-paratose 2-epimerase
MHSQSKKVLITGGCGFLGSNLAAYYLEQGDQVFIADALFRKGGESNLHWLEQKALPDQLKFINLDLADETKVQALFKTHAPFQYICHVGGQVAMTTSLTDPRRDLQTNIIGTFNILEAARQHSPEALIAYSSTNKVYGDLEHLQYEETPSRYILPKFPNGLAESLPLDFSTPYGCSKGSADQYVRDWNRVYGMKTVVFRHSSIYGGRQFSSFDQGWVGWFCQKALEQKEAAIKGRPIESFSISGTGKQVRDVLHAQDLIALYDSAYQNQKKSSGQIFNIGGGSENSLSLLELLDLLASEVGLNSLTYHQLARRQSDQDFFVADIRKAQKLLNWNPQITAKEGITQMLEWTRKTF